MSCANLRGTHASVGGTLSWTPPESGRRSGRLTPRTSRVDTTFFAPIPTDRLRTDQKRRLPRHLYSALLCPMTYARRLGLRRQLVGIGPSSWPQQRWPWTSSPTSHHPRPLTSFPPPAAGQNEYCLLSQGQRAYLMCCWRNLRGAPAGLCSVRLPREGTQRSLSSSLFAWSDVEARSAMANRLWRKWLS